MDKPKTRCILAVALAALAATTAPAAGQGARWMPPAADAEADELVDMGQLRAAGTKRNKTAIFDEDAPPIMRLPVRSLDPLPGTDKVTVHVEWSVRDHPHNGEMVFEKTEPVTLPPGEEVVLKRALPLKKPGPYWVRVALKFNGQTIKKDRLGILYRPDAYRPPLTRPDDFEAFWDQKLKAMREIPFEPELKKNEAYGTKHYVGYDLEITNHDGKRLKCALLIPRGDGPHDAEVGGVAPGDAEKIKQSLAKAGGQPVGVGMWQRGDRRIRVGAPSPRQAEFTYWKGRDENNMLNCYLQKVRLCDYLRSRDDVRYIWLFGASRGGPIALAAAALAPERVAAVNVHVPTCCGISWKDRPYRGWGRPPARTEEGLKTAAYFDPVNFAPDLAVPVVMDGGFYDGLSPIPGMLAFCNHATNAPFVRWSIEQGKHGYFQDGGRDEMEKTLAEHLAEQGIEPGKTAQ